ncbi:hypothetical protein FB451DRAFT_1389674 [Mycena latifolia]|nr:hypothetical protein FB451DRAFT_1389674 [Mycena latifolia]
MDTLLPAVQNAGCPSCVGLFNTSQTIAVLGDNTFIDSFTSLYVGLGAADPDVCTGLIACEGPIIAHDLRQINAMGQTAERLCDTLLVMCLMHRMNVFSMPFLSCALRCHYAQSHPPMLKALPFLIPPAPSRTSHANVIYLSLIFPPSIPLSLLSQLSPLSFSISGTVFWV